MKGWFEFYVSVFALCLANSVGWATAPFEVEAYKQSRGFSSTRDQQDQTLNEHIDPLTGNLFLHQTDFYLPGKAGLDLIIIRNYNAQIYDDAYPDLPIPTSWVGRGWSLHLGKLYIKESEMFPQAVFEMPDGSRHKFYKKYLSPDTILISKDFWGLVKTKVINGPDTQKVYYVTLNNGVKYMFWDSLRCGNDYSTRPVQKIVDPNNNSLTVYYKNIDGDRFIERVYDSCQRWVWFYSHKRESPPGTSRGVVLDSIGANNMTRVRYSYSNSDYVGYSLLDWAELSVGLRWNYTYISGGGGQDDDRLNIVTYPQSGIITYVYGNNDFNQGGHDFHNRAIFSRTATPGSLVTSYAYGGDGNGDSTTVTAPDGSKTSYRIYGYRSTPSSNNNWRIGDILSKRIWDASGLLIQTEAFNWNSAIISENQEEHPNGTWDYNIWAPLLAQKTIVRGGTTYTTNYPSYDSYGNPLSIIETGDNTRTIAQKFKTDPTKHIVDRLSSRRVTVNSVTFLDTLGYNSNGNLTYQNHYGVLTTFARNTDGTLASEKNARNYTTTYYYDISGPSYGVPARISYPEAVIVNRSVNWEGTIASETNGRGHTTSFLYDALNRLTRITPPTPWGALTEISYDNTSGRSKTVTRLAGKNVTYTYDEFGRLTRTANSEGVKVVLGYDNVGRKSYESFPYVMSADSVTRTYTYDGLGRVKRATNPDASYIENTYTGTSVDVRNERANTTTYEYKAFSDPDGDRWLTKVIQPNPYPPYFITTIYSYNAVGSLTKTEQGEMGFPKLTRTYTYNTKNFLTNVSTPEAGSITYVPDLVGNISSRTDANNSTTAYTYDGLNRLTLINYPGAAYDVRFQYDYASNRTRMAGARDTIWYYYDGANRDTCEVWKIDKKSKSISYRYDGRDNVDRIKYPSGRIVDFAYDTADRLSQIPGYISGTVSYHPSGGELFLTYSQTYPLNLTKTYAPLSHRLASLQVSNDLSFTYHSYDPAGNLTNWIDNTHGRNWQMGYDNIDRMTSVNLNSSTTNYSYDDYGDRLSSSQGLGYSYIYPSLSTRLSYINYGDMVWRNYAYDNNGNPRTITTQGQLDSLFYDYDNRLVTFKQKARYMGQDNVFRHTYQGDGLKVKTYREFPGPLGIQQDSTYCFYDRAGRVLEDSVAGGKVRDYIYANGQHLAVFWRTASDSGKVFYHCDHLGTPVAFSDASGQMIAMESYYPFGERLEGSGTFENSHRFTGKERDTTGLDYFGARWYDSGVGRFLNVDPFFVSVPMKRSLRNPQYLAPYVYCINNPLRLLDLSGEQPIEQMMMHGSLNVGDREIPLAQISLWAGEFADQVDEGLYKLLSFAPYGGLFYNTIKTMGGLEVSPEKWADAVLMSGLDCAFVGGLELVPGKAKIVHILQSGHAWEKLVTLTGDFTADYLKIRPILLDVAKTGKMVEGEPFKMGMKQTFEKEINGHTVQVKVFTHKEGQQVIEDAFVVGK